MATFAKSFATSVAVVVTSILILQGIDVTAKYAKKKFANKEEAK